LGLGNAGYDDVNYCQPGSKVTKPTVAVRYDKTDMVVDFIRRKDEKTLMGVACKKGKEPLVFFELTKIEG
jgi:hypothetical protein